MINATVTHAVRMDKGACTFCPDPGLFTVHSEFGLSTMDESICRPCLDVWYPESVRRVSLVKRNAPSGQVSESVLHNRRVVAKIRAELKDNRLSYLAAEFQARVGGWQFAG